MRPIIDARHAEYRQNDRTGREGAGQVGLRCWRVAPSLGGLVASRVTSLAAGLGPDVKLNLKRHRRTGQDIQRNDENGTRTVRPRTKADISAGAKNDENIQNQDVA